MPEDRILFLNLIASPEGINNFVKKFPQLKVVTAFIDEVCAYKFYCASQTKTDTEYAGLGREKVCMDRILHCEHSMKPVLTFAPSYIVPGLGDFGDRFYTM